MSIENLKISSKDSILNALKQMDRVRKKLLMVFSEDIFVGLISIGDIQRAIINNIELDNTIDCILRDEFIIANEKESKSSIKNKMFPIRAEFMPIVNDKNELVRVVFWKDLFEEDVLPPKNKFNLPIVIMAGGKGTRLKPITNVLPKPLIPIKEKPVIEHIFDKFSLYGCNNFYISVNYKSDLIKYYLKSENLPYNLNYFQEDKPMGTAGSLSLLKGVIKETFFVSNCDILIEQDYSEILEYHRENKNEITIVAALKHYSIPYGTIETTENGTLLNLSEKPEITYKINSGMYILEPQVLDEIPEKEFFHITHLIEKISKKNRKVGVFPVSEKSWKDMGDWSEYLKNK